MLTDDLLDRLYDPDLDTFLADVARSVPADAADGAVAHARVWHARRHAAVTAAFNPYRLGKGKVGGGRFAKRGDVGIPLLRDLLRGRGKARSEIHATFDKRLRKNDDWGRGDITPSNLTQWSTTAFGPRPTGADANAWDAGRRELGAFLAAIPDRTRVPSKPDTNPGDGDKVPDASGDLVDWGDRKPRAHDLATVESYEPDFSAMKYPVPKPLVEHITGGDGTRENPFTTGNVEAAAHLLANDQHVRLSSADQVSTLLDKLHADVQAMKAQGAKAPMYDLCKVTVPGTNLFCAESKGIPRIEMPQLGGIPIAGSKADALPKDANGGVDIGPAFIEHLKTLGINVTEKVVPASHLKASQNELNGAKIVGMMDAVEQGKMRPRNIFTSRDMYVVDGHHRWAANVGVSLDQGAEMNMGVNEVDADILDVLALANQFALDQGIPQAGVGHDPKSTVGGGHIPNIQPIDVTPPNAPDAAAPASPAAADGLVDWGDRKPAAYALSSNPSATGPTVRMSDDDYDALTVAGSGQTHVTGRAEDGSPIFSPERQALHDQIVEQLIAGVQPSENPIFYMLGGGPAAGKSTMLGDSRVDVPGEGEVVQIDSDHIKSLLPEYQQMVDAGDSGAASFVHEESSYLAKRVMATAFEGNLPTLLDGTGNSTASSVQKKVDGARAAGFKVTGLYATVPTEVAIQRADARGAETGRVVPHSVIEGTHASVSRIFPDLAEMFDDLMLFENSDGPNLIAEAHGPGTLQVHDQGEYDAFLAKATPNAPNVPEATAASAEGVNGPSGGGDGAPAADGTEAPEALPAVDPIPNIPPEGLDLDTAEEQVNERLRKVGLDPSKVDTAYTRPVGFERQSAVLNATDQDTADGIEHVLKGAGLDYTRNGLNIRYDGMPAAAPQAETPGQQSLLPRDQQTVTDLLQGDTSPENIAKLLKSSDLTDEQRAELHRLLDAQTGSPQTQAVAAALAVADAAAARRRDAAIAEALAIAERYRDQVS